MIRALVTGATGFVGGELAQRLLQEGMLVRGSGRKTTPALEAVGVEMRYGDLVDPGFCRELVSGCEVVFHVAAKAGVWGQPSAFEAANVTATRNLLQAAAGSGVGRFVFTSTPSVTFNGKAICGGDESLPYTSSRLSLYAWTKRVAEEEVLAADDPSGMRTTALRPHLIVGPGDNHLLPTILDRARSGRLKIVGSGRNRVDITPVEDVVAAHLAVNQALQSGVAGGRAYFITNDAPVELWPWINQILERAGVAPLHKRIPFPVAYGVGWICEQLWRIRRCWDTPPMTRFAACELAKDHWFSSQRAVKEIGYRPASGLDQAVDAYLQDSAVTSLVTAPQPSLEIP